MRNVVVKQPKTNNKQLEKRNAWYAGEHHVDTVCEYFMVTKYCEKTKKQKRKKASRTTHN